MIMGDPGEWFGGPFQEYLRTGLDFLALRIAVGNRLDGHAIPHLSLEGFEFSLDYLAVLLPELLILQPLLQAIHGHESDSRFLRRSLACVLRDYQAMLHPILAVWQVNDA